MKGVGNMGFSERLKALREQKHLSQEDLADKLNIPRSSIAHYENPTSIDEERIPRKGRLTQMANFFGVSVDYLLGRTEADEFTDEHKKLLEDAKTLTLEEIIAIHAPKINGRPATAEEIKKAIEIIELLRK